MFGVWRYCWTGALDWGDNWALWGQWEFIGKPSPAPRGPLAGHLLVCIGLGQLQNVLEAHIICNSSDALTAVIMCVADSFILWFCLAWLCFAMRSVIQARQQRNVALRGYLWICPESYASTYQESYVPCYSFLMWQLNIWNFDRTVIRLPREFW